jgi:hypothetical protein
MNLIELNRSLVQLRLSGIESRCMASDNSLRGGVLWQTRRDKGTGTQLGRNT